MHRAVEVESVGDDRTVYIRSSAFANQLPPSREWLGFQPCLGQSEESALEVIVKTIAGEPFVEPRAQLPRQRQLDPFGLAGALGELDVAEREPMAACAEAAHSKT